MQHRWIHEGVENLNAQSSNPKQIPNPNLQFPATLYPFSRSTNGQGRGYILFLSLLLSPFLLQLGQAEESGPQEAARAMVAAERKFYQTGQEKGTRAAFLAFLADDGIVFHPGPLNGRQVWQERPETGFDLIWEPIFASMARSADFGYTTGPVKWKPSKQDPKPTGYGQFISIWKKQKDGSWKVALDLGIENPEPTRSADSLRTSLPNDYSGTKIDLDARRTTLDEARRKLAGAAKTDFTDAVTSVADEAIRLYRNGSFPAVGMNAVKTLLAGTPNQASFESLGGDMSSSGDLAYSYGKYSTTHKSEKESGHFLQIWRTDKDGAWRLVLEWEQPR